MKSSLKTDVICVKKIIRYLSNMKDAFDMFDIKNADDLSKNEICQLAITQIITNIHELKFRLQEGYSERIKFI